MLHAPRRDKRSSTAAAAAWLAATGVALACAALIGGPKTGLYQLYAVRSGSMAPAIPAGAEVVVQPVDAHALQVGDVVTYTSPRPPSPTITHRVLAITTHGDTVTLRTKGDANLVPDPWDFSYAGQAGKVTMAIPFAGYVLAWATSPLVQGLAGALLALAAGALGLRLIWRYQRRGHRSRMRATSPGLRLRTPRAVSTGITLAALGATSLIGSPAYTMGAYSANTTNNNNIFSTASNINSAPVVSSITPADSATGVPVGTQITVTFSEQMDQASSQSAFSLQRINSGGSCASAPCVIAGSFSWPTVNNQTGAVLVFTPTTALDCSSGGSCANGNTASYQVTLGTGAKASQANNSLNLAATAQATFQTDNGSGAVAPPQVIPPTAPAGGSSSAKTDTTVQITFSNAMDASSTQAAFSLLQITGSCVVGGTTTGSALAGTFGWSGASANILTFTPTAVLTAGTCYEASVTAGSGGAQDIYGKNLTAGSPATNQFVFTVASGVTAAPNTPLLTSPSPAWTTSSTYAITGTVSCTPSPCTSNVTVEVQDGATPPNTVASEVLTTTLSSFSIPTSLNTGANTFTVRASIGSAHSGNASITINRNDPKSSPGIATLAASSTVASMAWPLSGDSNGNASAYACIIISTSGTSCTPALTSDAVDSGPLTASGSQFSASFSSLTGLRTYYVTTVLTDADGFDATSNCATGTFNGLPSCTKTNSILTGFAGGSGNGAGSITGLTMSPTNLTIATRAPQQETFSFNYNCGAGCSAASANVFVSSGAFTFNSPVCDGALAAPTGNTTVAWDGTIFTLFVGNHPAADGDYSYQVEVYNTNNCSGTIVATSLGTVHISNVGSVATINPAPNSVHLSSAGQTQTIVADFRNALNTYVSDGAISSTTAASPASNPSGATVTFSAVSSDGAGGFHLGPTPGATSWTATTGTSYTGTGGCSVAASTGEACAVLTIDNPIAHTITITASMVGQSGAISSQTAILDPPAPPSGLVLSPGSIRMAWQASNTLNVTGYKIFMGHHSGQYDRVIDVGNNTSAHIEDVEYGTTYFVTIRAYTAEGLSSEPSNEASITLPPLTATATVTATPVASATPTITSTATATATSTTTAVATATCITATVTPTPTATGSPTVTQTVSPTPTDTPAACDTSTATATATATRTSTVTATADASATPSATPASGSPTATASMSATAAVASPASTPTRAGTTLPSSTATGAPSLTPTPPPTYTRTPAATRTFTPAATATRIPPTATP